MPCDEHTQAILDDARTLETALRMTLNEHAAQPVYTQMACLNIMGTAIEQMPEDLRTASIESLRTLADELTQSKLSGSIDVEKQTMH